MGVSQQVRKQVSSVTTSRRGCAGFVMSGSRHKRMNAVRIRKENQVLNAEEQKAMASYSYEEKASRHTSASASASASTRPCAIARAPGPIASCGCWHVPDPHTLQWAGVLTRSRSRRALMSPHLCATCLVLSCRWVARPTS